LILHPTTWPEIFQGAPIRTHSAALLASALIPASFLSGSSLITFARHRYLSGIPVGRKIHRTSPLLFSGWAGCEFWIIHYVWRAVAKTWNGIIAPFFQFWLPNFGLWIPLALALVGFDRLAYLEKWMALG